jgi:hypothetical protein
MVNIKYLTAVCKVISCGQYLGARSPKGMMDVFLNHRAMNDTGIQRSFYPKDVSGFSR